MKNLLKTTVFICTILLSVGNAFAQTQFEAMKALGEGDYRVYDVHGKSGKYVYTFDPKTASTKFMRISFVEPSDARRFTVKTHFGSSKQKYALDEVGYGVTLSPGSVKHPKLKYLRRIDGTEKKRMVVMGDMIFYLLDYKGPDDFRIFRVMKKGKLSKLKAMKEYVKAVKMEKMGLEEKLKAQLKKEYAAQASALPKWKSANADYYAQIEKDKQTWKKLMKASDKERDRILAERRAIEARNSGRSSSSSSKSSSSKMVSVNVHAGTRAKNFVKVHWTAGGSSKKSAISSRSSSTIQVPAGAKLYYTIDNGSKKTFFMTAPKSGRASYKF